VYCTAELCGLVNSVQEPLAQRGRFPVGVHKGIHWVDIAKVLHQTEWRVYVDVIRSLAELDNALHEGPSFVLTAVTMAVETLARKFAKPNREVREGVVHLVDVVDQVTGLVAIVVKADDVDTAVVVAPAGTEKLLHLGKAVGGCGNRWRDKDLPRPVRTNFRIP